MDRLTINIVPTCKTNLIFELKTLRRKLINVVIGGSLTISRALISKENNDKHVIYAEGLGFAKIMTIPRVDVKRSFSNHISEI